LKSRVIGTKGRARKLIEELAGVSISIYGNTVSIIGESQNVRLARAAIELLFQGAKHSTVYKYLEKMRK
jgi:ribosomal RNA assembly protein